MVPVSNPLEVKACSNSWPLSSLLEEWCDQLITPLNQFTQLWAFVKLTMTFHDLPLYIFTFFNHHRLLCLQSVFSTAPMYVFWCWTISLFINDWDPCNARLFHEPYQPLYHMHFSHRFCHNYVPISLIALPPFPAGFIIKSNDLGHTKWDLMIW